jgi:uncharacterized protein (DUF427 family)
VVDSREPLLVWEPGRVVPLYCFPRRDVRMDLLSPAASPDGATGPRGEMWSLELNGRVESSAAWSYTDPELADHVALRWDALDAWYEEDEEVFGHPRDPHHRIDVLPSSRHVRVELDGELLAESARPHLLFETRLPIRFYLPADDIRAELVGPTDTHTRCPYKGPRARGAEDPGPDRLLQRAREPHRRRAVAGQAAHPVVAIAVTGGGASA